MRLLSKIDFEIQYLQVLPVGLHLSSSTPLGLCRRMHTFAVVGFLQNFMRIPAKAEQGVNQFMNQDMDEYWLARVCLVLTLCKSPSYPKSQRQNCTYLARRPVLLPHTLKRKFLILTGLINDMTPSSSFRKWVGHDLVLYNRISFYLK